MKRIAFIIGMTAILCAVSCSKKQNPEETPVPTSKMVFSGSLVPLSRSSFLDDTFTTLKWDEYDNIGIYSLSFGTITEENIPSDGHVTEAQMTVNPDFSIFAKGFGAININGTDPTQALFTSTTSVNDFMPGSNQSGVDDVYSFYAFYPAGEQGIPTPEAYGGDYGVRLKVLDQQQNNYYSNSRTSFGEYQICAAGRNHSSLYARSAIMSGENMVNLQFNPVTSLIRFRMQTAPGNTKSYTVKKIKLTLDNANLSGEVMLFPQNDPYPASGPAQWPLVSVATDAAAHSVTVDFESSLWLNNGFTQYCYAVVVPTNDIPTESTMTFVAYDENGQPVLSTTKILPKRGTGTDTRYGFRPGMMYTLDLQLDEFTAEAVAGKYNVYDWE